MYPELFTIPWLNIAVPSYGAMVVVGFLGATFWMVRRAIKVKTDPDIVLNIGFIVLIFSALSARTFYVVHYWEGHFADQPWTTIINPRTGGFEFYGGFIGAFIACYLYIWMKGLSRRLYADLITPSLLFAMGIGRIGCFLFGCCWGAPCPPGLPWAVRFPCSSHPHQMQWENREATLPAELILVDSSGIAMPMPRKVLTLTPADTERLNNKLEEKEKALEEAKATGEAKKIKLAEIELGRWQRGLEPLLNHFAAFEVTPASLRKLADKPEFHTTPLHPAQIYSAIGPLLLAWLTSAYFHRRKRHGMVMVVGFMLYAVERFIEEVIRVDNPQDTFGMTVSQAISIAVFLIALAWYFILQRMPLRSPRAVPWVQPDERAERQPSEPGNKPPHDTAL